MRGATTKHVGEASGGLLASPTSASERGAVTAETMLVLPVLVAVTMGMVWLVALGVTQVRVVDSAREVARAVARDEPRARAVDLGARIAPHGSRISVTDQGATVRVRIESEVSGPGGLFSFLPAVQVDAEASAAKEAP